MSQKGASMYVHLHLLWLIYWLREEKVHPKTNKKKT